MRVYLWNVNIRRDGRPQLRYQIVLVQDIVAYISVPFSSKNVKSLLIFKPRVAFQLDFLIVAQVVERLPRKLLAGGAQVHFIKVSKYPSVNIIATMDVQLFPKHNSHMIGATRNVLALDLKLGPAAIEGIMQLCLYDEVVWLFIKQPRLIAVEFLTPHLPIFISTILVS